MKKCTIGKRHKWDFVKNVNLETRTFTSIHFSRKGLYKCACGETKYAEMNPNG
ncbi:MAG: hypothetical protein [Bacteriophage sp.]|nr:MAG: hypothetical protein [Bacteriophage sp.]